MKNVISISEVVESREEAGRTTEVVATAEARFEEEKSELVTTLSAFLRPVDMQHKEQHLAASWLPRSETVREHVSAEDARLLAREIFHRWVRKVHQSTLATAHL